MPRKQAPKKVAKREVHVPVAEKPEAKVNAPVQTEPTAKALPVINGVQVVAIIPGETPTHFHVRMADGTTQHIDKNLFKN